MEFNWKILDIEATDGVISSAKYYCSVNDGDNTVETEGYASFDTNLAKVKFEKVKESMVIDWVKEALTQNEECLVEKRLLEQLSNLSKNKVIPPWKPQIFTPKL